jgi:hypothetical protein
MLYFRKMSISSVDVFILQRRSASKTLQVENILSAGLLVAGIARSFLASCAIFGSFFRLSRQYVNASVVSLVCSKYCASSSCALGAVILVIYAERKVSSWTACSTRRLFEVHGTENNEKIGIN